MPLSLRLNDFSSPQAWILPDASPFNDGVMTAAQAAKLALLTPGGGSIIENGGAPLVPQYGVLNFDGTSIVAANDAINMRVDVSIGNTPVTPGAYTNASITVGPDGRLTAAASGSASGGTDLQWLSVKDPQFAGGAKGDTLFNSNGERVSGTDDTAAFVAWANALNQGGACGEIPDGFYTVNCNLGAGGPIVLSPTYYPGVTHGAGDTQQSLIIRGNGGRTVICPLGDYYPIVNFNDVFQVNGAWSSVRFQDMCIMGNDANNPVQGPFDCASFVNVVGQAVTAQFVNLQFFGVASLNYVASANNAGILKSNALLSSYHNVGFYGCGAPFFGGAIANFGCLDVDNAYFQDYGGFNGWYQGKTSILGPYFFIGQGDSSSFGAPGKRIYSIKNARCDEGVNIALLFSRDTEPYHNLTIDNLQCMPALSSGGAISISNAERASIRGGNIYCRGPGGSPQIVINDSIMEFHQVKMDPTSRTPWTGGPGMVWLETTFGPASRAHFIDCSIQEIRGQSGINPADPSQISFTSIGCHQPLGFTDTQRDAQLANDAAVRTFFNLPTNTSSKGMTIYNVDHDQENVWDGVSAWKLSEGGAVP